jgi:hypothetical protein
VKNSLLLRTKPLRAMRTFGASEDACATFASDQLSAMDYQLSAFVPQAPDYGGQVRSSEHYGRGAGVGRGRGVGVTRGVALGVPVAVGVAVAVVVGVGVGV